MLLLAGRAFSAVCMYSTTHRLNDDERVEQSGGRARELSVSRTLARAEFVVNAAVSARWAEFAHSHHGAVGVAQRIDSFAPLASPGSVHAGCAHLQKGRLKIRGVQGSKSSHRCMILVQAGVGSSQERILDLHLRRPEKSQR